MNREERERMVERLLDNAFSAQEVEPRSGLEQRILANLRTQPERRPWRCRTMLWVPAAVAAVVALVIGVGLMRRPASPSASSNLRVPTSEQSSAQARNVSPEPWATSPKPSEPVREARVRRPRPTAPLTSSRPQAVTVTIGSAPRQEAFPSPAPLSDKERLFYEFVRRSPREAAMVAHVQEVDRIRADEFMQTGSAPVTAPVQ